MNNKKFTKIVDDMSMKVLDFKLSQQDFFKKNMGYVYDRYVSYQYLYYYNNNMIIKTTEFLSRYESDLKDWDFISKNYPITESIIKSFIRLKNKINNDIQNIILIDNVDLENLIYHNFLPKRNDNIFCLLQKLREVETMYIKRYHNFIEEENYESMVINKRIINNFRERLVNYKDNVLDFKKIKNEIMIYINNKVNNL